MPSTSDRFELVSSFELRGDQPRAIDELVSGLERGDRFQTLLGVTGSGKTFTMAQTIARVNRPALVMVHNKTLAAQLYQEFRRFFPHNAVEYFVSYYDYYQPEAYMPATDSYIEKEAIINEEIDRMRLSATRSLFERRDVIIVSSVSCIYGLGSPEAYYGLKLPLERGQAIAREAILRTLVEIQYERNDADFARGPFRVRGDVIEVYPSYDEHAIRIELFGDEIDEIATIDPLTGGTVRRHDRVSIYPKSHFVTSRDRTKLAIETIKAELVERRTQLEQEGRLLEARPGLPGAALEALAQLLSFDPSARGGDAAAVGCARRGGRCCDRQRHGRDGRRCPDLHADRGCRDVLHVEQRAEALMARRQQMLGGFQRRRLDQVDHDGGCEHADLAGAHARRGVLLSDDQFGGAGRACFDGGSYGGGIGHLDPYISSFETRSCEPLLRMRSKVCCAVRRRRRAVSPPA